MTWVIMGASILAVFWIAHKIGKAFDTWEWMKSVREKDDDADL